MTHERRVKYDDELQVVYSEVYSPGFPDSQDDYMTSVEVRKMAHNFLRTGNLKKIDVQHDNVECGAYVVESFVAREGDPIFLPDSWVVGVHVPSSDLWKKIKSGELNGFSMEGLVKSQEREIELEVPEVIIGETDGEDHIHLYEVRFDEGGNFLGGVTNVVKGHYHEIKKGTITGLAGDRPHTHRYSFLDQLSKS